MYCRILQNEEEKGKTTDITCFESARVSRQLWNGSSRSCMTHDSRVARMASDQLRHWMWMAKASSAAVYMVGHVTRFRSIIALQHSSCSSS